MQAVVELLGRGRLGHVGVDVGGVHRDDGQPHALSGADSERGRQVVVVRRAQVGVARDHQPVVAAHGAEQPGPVMADPRLDLPVVEARGDAQVELDPPPLTFDDAKQLAARSVGAATTHGEAVVEDGFAPGRAERRAQHEGVVHVGPQGDVVIASRADRAVPALLPIEDPGEAAAGVEPGNARPVDRAAPGDEGDGVTVADHGVVPDRRVRVLLRHGFACPPTGKVARRS